MLEEISFSAVPMEEQETVINIDYLSKSAHIYTSRINVAKRILKMCSDHADQTEVTMVNECGMEVSVPLDWIVIRPKNKRNLTPEQRQEMADRMRSVRQATIIQGNN